MSGALPGVAENVDLIDVGLAASVLAVLASAAFLATVLGRRSEPTTRPLIGVALASVLGAIAHLAVVDLALLRSAGLQWRLPVFAGDIALLLAYDVTVAVGCFWFLFALGYTGREEHTATVALTLVVAIVGLFLSPNVALAVLVALFGGSVEAVVGLFVLLATSLAMIGAFLVLGAALRHRAYAVAPTVLLAAGVAPVLVLPFAVTTLETATATPVAIAASSALFATALRRDRLLAAPPAAAVLGRDRVVDEMAEGVVVTGGGRRIRDLNPRAASILDVDPASAAGEPLDAVAPALPDLASAVDEGTTEVRLGSGSVLAVAADPVADARGRTLGHLLVCRDVTEQRRREHRLGVLVQLVAGATRSRMDAVSELAGAVRGGDRPPAEAADRIRDAAADVATLAARVRDVERALDGHDSHGAAGDPPTDVGAIVAAVAGDSDDIAAADARDVDAAGSTAVADPDPDFDGPTALPAAAGGDRPLPAAVDGDLLRATLETVVTGVGTTAEAVEVRAYRAPDAVCVAVGPRGELEPPSAGDGYTAADRDVGADSGTDDGADRGADGGADGITDDGGGADGGEIAALVVRVARLAAEHDGWAVRPAGSPAGCALTLRLPLADGDAAEGGSGGGAA